MCAFRISPSRATCSDHSDLPDSFNDADSLQISPRAKVAACLVGLPHVNWPILLYGRKPGGITRTGCCRGLTGWQLTHLSVATKYLTRASEAHQFRSLLTRAGPPRAGLQCQIHYGN